MRFGVQIGQICSSGDDHAVAYRAMLDDCAVAAELGYDSVWLVEHHFTDYFPTPSPLLFLSHVAARFPDLGLGTCVLVLPWYQPLRLAEEISMLSNLTRAHLHIGLGRGTAKIEYDAFDVPMEESRKRFGEGVNLIKQALAGETFQFQGDTVAMQRAVQMRPPVHRDRVHLYGAIGSPQSAAIMGELGLPPLSVGNFPFDLQRTIVDTWSGSVKETVMDPGAYTKPIVIGCHLADSDDEAYELARQLVPEFFKLQVKHYEVDQDHWRHIDGYQQFSKFFSNLQRLTDPDNLDPWMSFQLYGTPDTVEQKIRKYMEIGFTDFILSPVSPFQEKLLNRQNLSRFMTDVAPRFAESDSEAARL